MRGTPKQCSLEVRLRTCAGSGQLALGSMNASLDLALRGRRRGARVGRRSGGRLPLGGLRVAPPQPPGRAVHPPEADWATAERAKMAKIFVAGGPQSPRGYGSSGLPPPWVQPLIPGWKPA